MVLSIKRLTAEGRLRVADGFHTLAKAVLGPCPTPPSVADVPPGFKPPNETERTKAATSRSRSCQHAPPDVKQTANRDSTRRLEPSVAFFYPIFTSHFASIDFKFQHHIFLFQCFLRHLGVDPASHLVDVQWCHARLTYKLNSTFSCFGP